MAVISFYLKAPQNGDILLNPYGYIWVKEYSQKDGYTVISSQLMNDAEVDEYVDYLIEQLEQVRKQAKSDLRKAKQVNTR